MSRPTDEEYRKAAKGIHDTTEIDDDAVVSRADDEDDAYVQAWVWVDDDDAKSE